MPTATATKPRVEGLRGRKCHDACFDERRAYCDAHRSEQQEYDQEYYEVFRARRRAYGKKREADYQVWTNGLKAAVGCKTCAELDPKKLLFHHRDSRTKKFKISEGWKYTRETAIVEIKRYDVLCKSCHTRLHRGLEKEELSHAR